MHLLERMASITILSVLLFILRGSDYVTCQSNSDSDIRLYTNQFCTPGTANCRNVVINSPDVSVFRPKPDVSGGPTLTKSKICSPQEKQCSQTQGKCVAKNTDCNALNPRASCYVPKNDKLTIQVLKCGDNTPGGGSCGSGTTMPVQTELLVRCLWSTSPPSSFSLSAGAGLYLCAPTGTWEPKQLSPIPQLLAASCSKKKISDDCGRQRHSTREMPVHRGWSWVRSIFKNGQPHCTGTLVSQNAMVTAAHCVTSSPVSREADTNLYRYGLDLPGPDPSQPVRIIKPEQISIHPRYSSHNGDYEYDLAVIFFTFEATYNLPTVCLPDNPLLTLKENNQVVFNLQHNQDQQLSTELNWTPLEARWDHKCLATSPSFSERCSDTLKVAQSQFCAFHKGASSMSKGSTGGPYLGKVAEGSDAWVLMGILSSSSQVADGNTCFQELSVYEDVADKSNWIKDCVFDKRCTY